MRNSFEMTKKAGLVLTVLALIAVLTGARHSMAGGKFALGPGAEYPPPGVFEALGTNATTGWDVPRSCTIIYASDDKTALAGNNEDWTNPFPIVWFRPGKDGKFGYMCFGFQGGWPRMEGYQGEGALNEKGLFYDFATTEEVKVPRDPDKPDSWGLSGKMITECSTVDEAIKLFSEYNLKDGVWKGHYLIGDRFGNSAIIEPLAVIRWDRKYQIATNFLQSRTDPKTSDDPRYRLASRLFEQSDEISLDLFRRILDATHMEDYGGSYSATLYSYIHDLAKGDVYIYNFHDYDRVVKLNIHEELKKGEHVYLISSPEIRIGILQPARTEVHSLRQRSA